MQKILLFAFIIFIIALSARLGSYLDTLQPALTSFQYYQGIGSGNDADYQIKNAIFIFTQQGLAETLTHYDYIFLIPLIAFFLGTFGYVQGLEYILYFIIFLGSLVPVILFAVLAKRTPYFIGALLVGLALTINPLLVSVSAGRFILDTLVQFIFALFVVCYLLAVEKKSLLWLVLLGIIAVIQGLNKPFLMVNDLSLLLVFPLFFLIKEITYKKTFPFITITWKLSKKMAFYGLIPFLIYIVGNIGWEIYLEATINRGYFLKEIFLSNASDSSTNFALRDSLVLAQTPWEKLRNIGMFSLMALEQVKIYSYIPVSVFAGVIFFYILSKRDRKTWFKGITILFISLTIFYFFITQLFFIPGVTTTNVPATWNIGTFASFAIVTILMLLFMHRSIPLLAMTAMQIPYLIAVGLTITTAIFPRHFETLVIWFVVCIALLIDSFVPKVLSKFSIHVYRTAIVMIFLLFSLPLAQSFLTLKTAVGQELRNIAYLIWVGKQVPHDGYILAGSGENLISITKYTNKQVMYNSFHMPVLANYTDSVYTVKDFSSIHTQPMPLTTFLPKYAKEKKLYVTDMNKNGWDQLLTVGKLEIPQNMYALEVAAQNPKTKRILYRLILNTPQSESLITY